MSYQKKSVFTGWREIVEKNDKDKRFNVRASSKAKHKCQLIVRLKNIEYKEEIFRYLFFHINLLSRLQLVLTF